MINQVFLVGRVSFLDNYKKSKNSEFISFSLAVEDFKKNTQFFRVTAFGKSAEIVDDYVEVGAYVAIRGHLQNSEYEDEDKTKRFSTNIILDELQLIGKTSSPEDNRSKRRQ